MPIHYSRPDLPFPIYDKNHPMQLRDPRRTNTWDPMWKQLWGQPATFNPSQLPLAPESSDLTEDETKAIEEFELQQASNASGSSSFWESHKKSADSQSSYGSSVNHGACHTTVAVAETPSIMEAGTADDIKFKTAADTALETTIGLDFDLEPDIRPMTRVETIKEHLRVPAMHVSTAKIFPDKIGFLDLPGEIRNRIYSLAFSSRTCDYEIAWLSKGKDLKHYRSRAPIKNRAKDVIFGRLRPHNPGFHNCLVPIMMDPESAVKRRQQVRTLAAEKRAAYSQKLKAGGCSADTRRDSELDSSSEAAALASLDSKYDWTLKTKGFMALLGLNRQIHDEAASLAYSRSTFSFASHALMAKFLDNLTPIARHNICKIYLVHDMQNIPILKKNLVNSEKDQRKLVNDLQAMTACCKSLTELHVLLVIRGSYLRLQLSEPWAKDLANGLSNLKHLKDLQTFELNLILNDDTTNVSAAATIRPRDDQKINRATQLVDAADMVRREILKDVELKSDQTKNKGKMKVLRIIE